MTALLHWLLQRVPAETAHRWAVAAMRRQWFAPGTVEWTEALRPGVPFLDRRLSNPLGLAAGFDKNGLLVGHLAAYGFGFSEIGSVTWEAHPGNPRPRLFRLRDAGLLNRMGLNSHGAEAVRARLSVHDAGTYGISIAKTNRPTILGDAGLRDVLRTFALLAEFGLYHVFNLSCPNTHAGVTFEDPAVLRELLPEVRRVAVRPWGVKLSPWRDLRDMEQTVEVCEAHGCQVYVLGNTQPWTHPRFGRGGLSGQSLRPLTLPRVRWLASRTRAPVVACGGVLTGVDAFLYEQAGAAAVQAYTGFVRGPYSGPGFAPRVLREWRALRLGMQGFV